MSIEFSAAAHLLWMTMAKNPGSDPQMEATGRGLKELVLRWFTETQASLIMSNGNFPDWFQGLAARKDAEDLLRDKTLGCFLIRLSDKAVGYILSYRGHDRCRHFVITQNPEGRFLIAGDCQLFGSLTELIDYYKVTPIEPFGECLTSSCREEESGDLYDVVSAKDRSGVNVQALRSMWDHQREPGNNQRTTHHAEASAVPAPVLPTKHRTRKLTGTLSVDPASLSKGLPSVPKRGIPSGFQMGGSFPDSTPHPDESQPDSNGVQRIRRSSYQVLTPDRDFPGDLCPAGTLYAELSRSLPHLEGNLQPPCSSSPAASKKVTCVTYSLLNFPEGFSSSESGGNQELQRSNPLYQTNSRDGMYEEVPQGSKPSAPPDETYEAIPAQSNTYESLQDMKSKKTKKNNINWKKFLPDYKKK